MKIEKRLQKLMTKIKNEDERMKTILNRSISPKKSFLSSKTRKQSIDS